MATARALLSISLLRGLKQVRRLNSHGNRVLGKQDYGGVLFDKILIANRGEIACRVMKTAKRLGVKTVAVYSEADRNSLHLAMADEGYCIGPAPSNESYLVMNKIIDVAKSTNAQAIHPGYGFLSENRFFSDLCLQNGIEFVGPPAYAIEKMGIKRVSKAIMSKSGVPIVPGYYGDDQSDKNLKYEADKIGYPVLIKADLGGGGKGMRVVEKAEDFQNMLNACRSEAMKSFSDDKVLIEKFVERPRHVEVQVFADKFGNTVHLFERDCSVQRRHQKIIEEAPAPGLDDSTRNAMWTAAVKAAQAVGYVGAGTVEFIMDAYNKFYFMEMNTRLQVEHPITEMITGADLVEWQLKVAAGQPLPVKQSDIVCNGHSFEARVYAEDPDQSFMPSPGFLHHLTTPPVSDTIRIDTGVRQGDEVSAYYDPMIAKLVVWSHDRTTALRKLNSSLKKYQIAGLKTNVNFLTRLSQHQSFVDGDVHTGFIQQHDSELFPSTNKVSNFQQRLATLCLLSIEQLSTQQSNDNSDDPFSLFNTTNGGRVNGEYRRTIKLLYNGEEFETQVIYNGANEYTVLSDDDTSLGMSCDLHMTKGGMHLYGFVGTDRVQADLVMIDDTIYVFTDDDNSFSFSLPQPHYQKSRSDGEVGGVWSPTYSTRVNKVLVKVGDIVEKGHIIMTVEGMKMETNILSPKKCLIEELFFNEGDIVPGGSRVCELDDIDDDTINS